MVAQPFKSRAPGNRQFWSMWLLYHKHWMANSKGRVTLSGFTKMNKLNPHYFFKLQNSKILFIFQGKGWTLTWVHWWPERGSPTHQEPWPAIRSNQVQSSQAPLHDAHQGQPAGAVKKFAGRWREIAQAMCINAFHIKVGSKTQLLKCIVLCPESYCSHTSTFQYSRHCPFITERLERLGLHGQTLSISRKTWDNQGVELQDYLKLVSVGFAISMMLHVPFNAEGGTHPIKTCPNSGANICVLNHHTFLNATGKHRPLGAWSWIKLSFSDSHCWAGMMSFCWESHSQ